MRINWAGTVAVVALTVAVYLLFNAVVPGYHPLAAVVLGALVVWALARLGVRVVR